MYTKGGRQLHCTRGIEVNGHIRTWTMDVKMVNFLPISDFEHILHFELCKSHLGGVKSTQITLL
jgi:hypothetical protein